MEKKVLIPSDISQPGKDYLAEKGYTIKMGRGTDEQTILEDVADCDALLARNEHITRAIMEAAPRLKVISKHGVGLDKIDLDAARELNIWVTNGPLSNTVAVAEHIGGSVEEFAEKMNRKAREIGCKNVCFVTPNGLDVADADGNEHSASAADMARIMRYCAFQSPCREIFLEITRTASRTIQDESGNRSFYLANHNALLSQCAEVLSGKTGFTGKAGYCYVAALKKEGKAFTVALLGCGWPPHKTYKWADMRKLDQYAFDTYNWYDIFDREKTFPEVEVRRGVKGTTALTLNLPSEKQTFLMLLRADEKPDIRYEYPTELEAPVHEGQEVGQASYYINDEQVAAYPIYAAETVEKIDYEWCLRRCVTYFEREFQSMWQTWGV